MPLPSAHRAPETAPAAPLSTAPHELATPATATAVATLPDNGKLDEGDSARLLERCRTRAADSKWADAIADCRKAAELAPSSAGPYAELMRIYVTIGSYSEGAEAARAVLERNADSAPAYYYLGWSLTGSHDYRAAIAALVKAVTIDPARIEYRQGLGIAYCQAEEFGPGIDQLEAARKLKPKDAKTKRLLEGARAQAGEHLRIAEQGVEAKPADPAAHATLGRELQKYGFREAALSEYGSALASIPAPIPGQSGETKQLATELYYNRGVLYRELGRGDSAAPEFAQALELDPSLAPQAYYFIGMIAGDKGDTEGAISALGKSVDRAPKTIKYRDALAAAYEKAGKTAAAKEQRAAIAKLQPQGSQADN
ncbi:MAG: tetratricopeptide repeat protein [Deltaproteobacteria bacterium]|nr:tetratricopeptide repeat protein [Deltaproteobacteria bacterium]